jgi:hypothetical protein
MEVRNVAASTVHPSGRRRHHVASKPGSASVIVIVVVCVALAVLILYSLWAFWPVTVAATSPSTSTTTTMTFFGWSHRISTDIRLFVVVALAGTLGALMHSMRSLAYYVGHHQLKWRWIPYYMITLLLGAGLGTIIYIVIRGGLFASSTGDKSVNPYGFAAVAALTGLFTEEALEMLRKVATDFFAPPPAGPDKLVATGDETEPEDEMAPETTAGAHGDKETPGSG